MCLKKLIQSYKRDLPSMLTTYDILYSMWHIVKPKAIFILCTSEVAHTWSTCSTLHMIITQATLLFAAAFSLNNGSSSTSVAGVWKSPACNLPEGYTLHPRCAHRALMGYSWVRWSQKREEVHGRVWLIPIGPHGTTTTGGSEPSLKHQVKSLLKEACCILQGHVWFSFM